MKTLRTVLASVSALVGMLLLLPVIVIAIPLWLVSFLLRRCYLIAVKSQPWEAIIDFNKYIGWEPKPNLDVYCSFAPGSFHVKTDPHGWRGKEDLTRCQALVLGDSFAFGFGIDDANAFFSITDSGLRIKAIGAPGYNMVQEVIWLEKISAQLRGKLVIWFICLGNDLPDNLQPNMQNYRTPFVRRINSTGDWQIVTEHVRPEAWHYNVEHNFRSTRDARAVGTFSNSFLSSRAYSACEFLIGRAKEVCTHSGVRLAIVSIPSMAQLDPDAWNRWASKIGDPQLLDAALPDRRLQEICQKLDLPFIAGRDHLKYSDYIHEDGHWNKSGHKQVAKLLANLYFQYSSSPKTARKMSSTELEIAPLRRTRHSNINQPS